MSYQVIPASILAQEARLICGQKESPVLLRDISQHVHQCLVLPVLFTGQVSFVTDHAPFTTRQFAGSIALFAVLYFIAVAFRKRVLYLDITCLNSQPQLSLLMSNWQEGYRARLRPSLETTACNLAGTHSVCSLLSSSAGWWLEPVVSFAEVQMAILRNDALPLYYSPSQEMLCFLARELN